MPWGGFVRHTHHGRHGHLKRSEAGRGQMIGLGTGALKIFVALEAQDLRKSFQGLTELALQHRAVGQVQHLPVQRRG
jgi:hypothetical protein